MESVRWFFTMSRGIGEPELLERLPEAATAVAGLVTQLGDAWFVLVAVGVLFVLGTRDQSLTDDPASDCAFLFALVVGAYSATTVFKYAFALPRPPGVGTATPPAWLPALAHAAYESLVTADGYGFPSGHALKTVAVYGGGALILDVWDRNRRLVVAGAVTAVVAASRVVLGVHYAVDVVVGVAVGAAFLTGTMWLTDGRPTPALTLSTVLGGLAFATAGDLRSGLALSAAAAGLAVWVATDRAAAPGADPAER
jgi:membrane-associated phospholipid phosphatase